MNRAAGHRKDGTMAAQEVVSLKGGSFSLPKIGAAELLAQPEAEAYEPSSFDFDIDSMLSPPPSFASPMPPRRAAGPATVPGLHTPSPGYSSFAPPKPVTLPKGSVNVNAWTGHGTHITDGLDMNHGQKTAVDIMAKPGTAVPAPRDGVVVRLGSAQGGESMYFRDNSGKTWWLGHIDGRYSLPPGTRVKAGQTLSRISAKHGAPHLHLDREL